jgi:hypothetical protein
VQNADMYPKFTICIRVSLKRKACSFALFYKKMKVFIFILDIPKTFL